MTEQQEVAEFYERLLQKPKGSFRCVYDGVPIFEVGELPETEIPLQVKDLGN